MADKAKHAYGSSANLDAAISAGKIDAYDLLFLDGDTAPKIGWVDKNGNPIIVEGKDNVVVVDELPAAGENGIIYVYNNECYIWDGSQCVAVSKSADLTTLESQVSTLETQMESKVDEATVTQMITKAIENEVGGEVVEF